MPSSKLLKTLLSEPIRSWRNSEGSFSPDSLKPLTDKSENSSSRKITRFNNANPENSNRSEKIESKENENNNCLLLPGLTTKPPLPTSASSNRESIRANSPTMQNSIKDKIPLATKYDSLFQESPPFLVSRNNKTDLEKIGFENEKTMEAFDFKTPRSPTLSVPEKTESKKGETKLSQGTIRDAFMADSDFRALFSGRFDDEQKFSDGLSSVSEPENLVKNWASEDKTMDKEVYMSEKQTDLYLSTLKKQQEELEEDDVSQSKAKRVLDNDLETDEKFRKFFGVRPENKDEYYVERPKKLEEDDFEKIRAKMKSNVTIRSSKLSPISSGRKVSKPTFTATAIKSKSDFLEKYVEEDSWISKYETKETDGLKNKDIDKWITDNSKITMIRPKHVSYNDVLEDFDELEEEAVDLKENKLEDQCSVSTADDNGPYDDIVSILHDLEDADKVSRK